MQRPATEPLRGPWRRRLFWGWIAATMVLALFVGLAAPFASYFGEGYAVVGAVVPAFMIILTGTVVAWLAALTLSRPSKGR